MKDFIYSNYLRGFGFTYYEFSSNLARLRLNFPLIIAQIEKHTERVFFPFMFQLIFLLIYNI